MTRPYRHEKILLEHTPIQVEQLQKMLADWNKENRYGAVVTFWGTVRDEDDHFTAGAPIAGIEYETYSELFLGEVDRIIAEIRDRFGSSIGPIVFAHRLDAVPVGEITSCAVIAATHRREAFMALDMLTSNVKERVPIWKKLIMADGSRCKVRMNIEDKSIEYSSL